MKKLYQCEICGNTFGTEKECKEHEKICNTEVKIKCISLVWNVSKSLHTIEIVEYQKVKYFDGVYKLCTWYDNTDWEELTLDEIIYDGASCVNKIYTTDFSKETEQKYINLLKKNEQQFIQQDQEILNKQLESVNTNLQIERRIER